MKPDSEALFERFLKEQEISFESIPRGKTRTPDYKVFLKDFVLVVEVTTIRSKPNGDTAHGYAKTVGEAIRREIKGKSKQLRWANDHELPSLLLLHEANALGMPWFLEDHDFRDAMYGALTMKIGRSTGKAGPFYNGRDAELRPQSGREHISALGRIGIGYTGKLECVIFPNLYAGRPIAVKAWPRAFDVRSFELEDIDVTPPSA